jgi:hypothetical protein
VAVAHAFLHLLTAAGSRHHSYQALLKIGMVFIYNGSEQILFGLLNNNTGFTLRWQGTRLRFV